MLILFARSLSTTRLFLISAVSFIIALQFLRLCYHRKPESHLICTSFGPTQIRQLTACAALQFLDEQKPRRPWIDQFRCCPCGRSKSNRRVRTRRQQRRYYLPSKQLVGETSLESVVSGIIGRWFDPRKLIGTMTIPAHCVVFYPRALSEFESVLKHPEELARPSSSDANSSMFHF